MMKIREVLTHLISKADNIDEDCCVTIVERRPEGSVVRIGRAPVVYVALDGIIKIEYSDIEWEDN